MSQIGQAMRIVDTGPSVDIGAGLVIREWLEVDVDAIDMDEVGDAGERIRKYGLEPLSPYPLRIRIAYEPETGRYEVVTINVTQPDDGPRITSEGLRSIPIGAIRQRLSLVAVVGVVMDDRIAEVPRDWRPPHRSNFTDETYRMIWVIHRRYRLGFDNSVAMLAAELGVSPATAHRWLREAEERDVMAERWDATMGDVLAETT